MNKITEKELKKVCCKSQGKISSRLVIGICIFISLALTVGILAMFIDYSAGNSFDLSNESSRNLLFYCIFQCLLAYLVIFAVGYFIGIRYPKRLKNKISQIERGEYFLMEDTITEILLPPPVAHIDGLPNAEITLENYWASRKKKYYTSQINVKNLKASDKVYVFGLLPNETEEESIVHLFRQEEWEK